MNETWEAMSRTWETLGHACRDTVAELEKLGLPKEGCSGAVQLIWKIACWQGDRCAKFERVRIGERLLTDPSPPADSAKSSP